MWTQWISITMADETLSGQETVKLWIIIKKEKKNEYAGDYWSVSFEAVLDFATLWYWKALQIFCTSLYCNMAENNMVK